MAEDQSPSNYIVELINEGRFIEAITASHVERCFLYGCANSGDPVCRYCGRAVMVHPPLGIVEAQKRATITVGGVEMTDHPSRLPPFGELTSYTVNGINYRFDPPIRFDVGDNLGAKVWERI